MASVTLDELLSLFKETDARLDKHAKETDDLFNSKSLRIASRRVMRVSERLSR